MKHVLHLSCLLMACFAGLSPHGLAQETPPEGEVSWVHGQKVEDYDNISGSPYYLDWGRGTIRLKNGHVYENMRANYDIFSGKLCIQNELQGTVALHSEIVAEATLVAKDQIYRFTPLRSEAAGLDAHEGGDLYVRFYEQRYDEGKFALLKLPIKVFVDKHNNTTSSEFAYDLSKLEGSFQYKEFYLLRLPSGTYQKVRKRKGAILAALGPHKGVAKTFAKEHNLSFAKEDDLRRLLAFLDQQIN